MAITKRARAIARAKMAGYYADTKAFTRLIIESRVNRPTMLRAFEAGRQTRLAELEQLAKLSRPLD